MAGCEACCPTQNRPCVGCWGILDEANHSSELKLLKEKGFSGKDVINRFRLYGGSDMEERLAKLLKEDS
jgi:hypothetical protein